MRRVLRLYLHLPDGFVVLPVVEGVELGHPGLVNADLLLLIVK